MLLDSETQKLSRAVSSLLSLPVKDEAAASHMREMGISKKHLVNRMRLLVSLFDKACEGNVSAFKELCDMSEQSESPALLRLDEILREVKDDAADKKTENLS